MGAEVLPLDYFELRVEGATLVRCGLRHTLAPRALVSLAEALQDARVLAGTWAAAGFVIESDGDLITMMGWDMGPILLTSDQATTVCFELAFAFGQLSPEEQERARFESLVRKVRSTQRQPAQPRLIPTGDDAA